MRTLLVSLLITLGQIASSSAQGLLRVHITDGQFRAWMEPASAPYATGGPWVAVPTRPLTPEVTPTVTDFRIRTWLEGNGVRVLVFAVTRTPGSAPNSDGERETQIASVAVNDGQS